MYVDVSVCMGVQTETVYWKGRKYMYVCMGCVQKGKDDVGGSVVNVVEVEEC